MTEDLMDADPESVEGSDSKKTKKKAKKVVAKKNEPVKRKINRKAQSKKLKAHWAKKRASEMEVLEHENSELRLQVGRLSEQLSKLKDALLTRMLGD
jgi:hypothetical protein